MGTSKGYVPPTKPEWSNAKRAVSAMIKNGDIESITKAASRYAEAMLSDGGTIGESFAPAAGKFIGVAKGIANNGLERTLVEFGRDDLIGKDPEEILQELLDQFTNNQSTNEDSISADAISQAFDNLGVLTLEDLGNIDIDELLREMITEYVNISFDLRFEEKIGKSKSPREKEDILKNMHSYIADTIHSKFDSKSTKDMDFSKLNSSAFVLEMLKDALTTCKDLCED